LRDADQKFFDSFMLVVGILVGVAVALFFLVSKIAIDTQGEFVLSDPTVRAEIDERIMPVGHVVLMGSDELAAAQAQAAPVTEPARVATVLTGPQVYNESCINCHASGLAGAPMTGDAAAWTPRIAKGMDVLIEHALNGFQGDTGFMPAKGGFVNLSDDEVRSAVQYLVDQVQQ
jgi:cytochrome c5